MNIGEDTVGRGLEPAVEELFGGAKRGDVKPGSAKHSRKRSTNGGIILDDCDAVGHGWSSQILRRGKRLLHRAHIGQTKSTDTKRGIPITTITATVRPGA
jgi:hypothetical protein